VETPKGTSLTGNVLAYRSCRSARNTTWARGEKKRKKEKRKKTQRCDNSHICPDHPRRATRTKVVMWGVFSDAVNRTRFHQNRSGVLYFHLFHFCISLYTCANVLCIELLLTYLLTGFLMHRNPKFLTL